MAIPLFTQTLVFNKDLQSFHTQFTFSHHHHHHQQLPPSREWNAHDLQSTKEMTKIEAFIICSCLNFSIFISEKNIFSHYGLSCYKKNYLSALRWVLFMVYCQRSILPTLFCCTPCINLGLISLSLTQTTNGHQNMADGPSFTVKDQHDTYRGPRCTVSNQKVRDGLTQALPVSGCYSWHPFVVRSNLDLVSLHDWLCIVSDNSPAKLMTGTGSS